MKTYKPFLLFLCFFIFVGLACFITGSPDPTATPVAVVPVEETPIQVEPVVEEVVPEEPTPTFTSTATTLPSNTPTTKPTATDRPTATQPPTQEPVDEPLAYFIEEFEGDIDSWSYFLISGDESKMDLYANDGKLVFDLQGENQWVYMLYDEYYYPEVRIDVLAENRGKNTNNVSLICHYSDRDGWYEFNVSNGGLYYILVYSELDGDYFTLASGGSTNVNMGRDINLYTAICDGNKLSLYINNVLEREIADRKYNLQEGKVGVSVSSFDVLPILVEVDYFSISLP